MLSLLGRDSKGAIDLACKKINVSGQRFYESLISFGLKYKIFDDEVEWFLLPEDARGFLQGIDHKLRIHFGVPLSLCQ